MQKPAPKGIVQSAEQPTEDLHKNVKGPLGQMGYSGPAVPPTETKLPLTEELKQFGVDAEHVVTSTFEEVMSGTGGSTLDRVASQKNPISLAWERAKRLRFTRSKANEKKAA